MLVRLKHTFFVMMMVLMLSACAVVAPTPQGSDVPKTGIALSSVQEKNVLTELKTGESIAPSQYPLMDLWERVRKKMSLDRSLTQEEVQKQVGWFQKHQDYLDRTLERATPVLHYIVEMVDARHMPAELALLPIIESAYNPLADSPVGAGGLWQIMPPTAKNLGLRQSWWYDGRRDAHASTVAALNYLEYLHRYFDGDWLLAVAAYNTGEGNVARAIQRNRKAGKPTDFWSLPLAKQTRIYVPTLLALSEIVSNPSLYGMRLEPILNISHIVKVDIQSQMDISFAARIADIKVEDLYKLNPGFFRWATDPDGPHYLLLPQKNAQLFRQRLSALALHERISWQPYQVRSGETLLSVANKFHASPDQLRSKNNLSLGDLRPGRTLMVPQISRVPSHVKLPRVLPMAARDIPKEVRTVRVVTAKRGDTLLKLSKRYRVNLKKLAAWNDLAPNTRLVFGQKIKIFVKSKPHSKKGSKRTAKKKYKKGKQGARQI